MKWETYKTLTKKQKEEYDYKFGNIQNRLNLMPMILSVLLLMMMTINVLLMAYLFLIDSAFASYTYLVQDILKNVRDAIGMFSIIILGAAFVEISICIINRYKEHKFIKNNNITVIKSLSLKKVLFGNKKT